MDAKEQHYLERFEVLFMRVHNGLHGRLWAGTDSAQRVSSKLDKGAFASAKGRETMRSRSRIGGARMSVTLRSSGGDDRSIALLSDSDADAHTGFAAANAPASVLPRMTSSINGDAGSLVAGAYSDAGSGGSSAGSDDHKDSELAAFEHDIASEAFQLVDAMPPAEQERWASAICTAIKRHVHFPAACDTGRAEGKITFPRTYLFGLVPSCRKSYDFSDRNFALKIPRISFDAIALLSNDIDVDVDADIADETGSDILPPQGATGLSLTTFSPS